MHSYSQYLANVFPFHRLSKWRKIGYEYPILISRLESDKYPVFQYKSNWEHTFDTIRGDMIKNNTW